MNFQEKFTIVSFIGTLYNEFNNFQFGTVINGIKILVKGMLPNVSENILFLLS